MKGEQRRSKILEKLQEAQKALSASFLAKEFGVSRQIIVGDIALLRASGEDILATGKGYLLNKGQTGLVKHLACQHTPEQTREELEIILNHGGKVIDVIVDHPIYGELKGGLYLNNLLDMEDFLTRVKESRSALLSTLTSGVHLHTIVTPSEAEFSVIKKELQNAKILYED